MILKNSFNTCEKQTSLIEYLQETIEHTGATPEHLAREFHIDGEDLKKLLG